MSFTDQKPRSAREKHLKARWSGKTNGFRCYLCGHAFALGDTWRWVYAGQVRLMNFLVCGACDGPDVLERWQKAQEEFKTRFWWACDW